ncbi:unnamed protein product [Leuciscus chuanchicus]
MLEKGQISKPRQEECTSLNRKACSEDVDTVFPIFWGEQGLSERYIYFSVYTGQKDNWCRLGRTICTFDSKTGKWHCRCRGTKYRISCAHRYLSMWWLFQEHPQLLQNAVDNSNEELEDMEENFSATDDIHQHSENSHSGIITQTNYFWSSKRIPEDLPVDLTTEVKPIPEHFETQEVEGPYCPGPSPPNLEDRLLITRQATVYGIFKQYKGVSVYAKECPVCRNLVRFQEYKSGFHNYNNRVFLSIPLCSFLTAGISVINLMRRPDIENIGPQDTQANVAARWEDLEKEIIATGFCDDSSNNPYTSPLTYSAFAPWIGKHTRVDDKVPKTEINKGLSQSERVNSACREGR